jgi:hypothetical protein
MQIDEIIESERWRANKSTVQSRTGDCRLTVQWKPGHPLPLEAWSETHATLHRWLQIVGKIRLSRTPWINHSWHVPLYVSARGLTTTAIPYDGLTFELRFDFIDHVLIVESSDGRTGRMNLASQSVASFYSGLMATLDGLGLPVSIHRRPNEVDDPIRFDQDEVHRTYDGEYANRYWRILAQSARVLTEFRCRFIGKCSPVHFFWGAPDLAVTRFSGRRAPEHPGGIANLPDRITREAYSHEVSSAGFWAGWRAGPLIPRSTRTRIRSPPASRRRACAPPRRSTAAICTNSSCRTTSVRQSASPDATLLEFLQSTYEAAANLAQWDRGALERSPPAR